MNSKASSPPSNLSNCVVLAICITSTNTLSTLLANEGTSIPAFQTLFNYVLLNLVYTTYTIYQYGWKKWLRLLVADGWRFFILAFFDVEGNYFVVLAYRYVRCSFSFLQKRGGRNGKDYGIPYMDFLSRQQEFLIMKKKKFQH